MRSSAFLISFYKIYDEEKPTHVAVAFDVHEPTFRHKMFADYKGTRKGMDDELREQFPIIKDLLHLMGIKTFERGGYEADDIIGTLSVEADKEGYQVTVLSGDRDLLPTCNRTGSYKNSQRPRRERLQLKIIMLPE